MPTSNARCSASVSAERGVSSRSTDGASARLRNIATFDSAPESSKFLTKYWATSCLTPMPAKMTANSTSSPMMLRLAGDLRGDLVVRQAVAAEDGQFLPAHQRVHAVERGDAGLDEVARVDARVRVHRLAVDVAPHAADRRGAAVGRAAQPVEDAPEHGPRDLQVQRFSQETHPRPQVAQPGGPFEDLHHRAGFHRVEHAADAPVPGRVGDLDHFVETDGVPRLDQHQRAVNAGDADVFHSLSDKGRGADSG